MVVRPAAFPLQPVPKRQAEMGDAPRHDEAPQAAEAHSLGQVVDRLCDEFEAQWRSGARPEIEHFLPRVAPAHRLDLLAHLLATELFWRHQKFDPPTADEYHRRFPDARQIIDDLFHSEEHELSLPDAQAETAYLASSTHVADKPHRPRPFGNYQLIEEIGRGGMGVVYRAWQPSADRHVALKLIRRDRFESLPESRQTSVLHRFEHEAQAAGRIQHDHIVTVYEVGEIDGEHFFSMRYVEGQSLNERLKQGPLPGRRAAAYLEPVARAVHEAHLHGILHRDLKPQNILIDAKTDRALVLDFGLAKLAEHSDDVTEAGDVMGTPPYMPPEQTLDSSQVTAKSDVYSLGATLYHAVVGRPPFQAKTVVETIRLVAEQTPIAPRQADPHIDRDLETICLKCLEKDPVQRYPSAEALADELHRYLHNQPIEARPLSALGRTIRWCRRSPLIATLLCCTVLFFFAALAASITGYLRTSQALAVSERESRRSQATVDWFTTRVSEEKLLDQPGLQPLRQELLTEAMRYYEQFVRERSDDPTVREQLAMNAYRLGRITDELDAADKAETWYHQALQIQEDLLTQRPQDATLQQALGDTLNAMGKIALARRDLDAAKDLYQRAATQREQLALAVGGNTECQRKLANSYMNLGVVARESGQMNEALERYVQAKTLRYEIRQQDPHDMATLRDQAMGCFNLGNFYSSILAATEHEETTNLEAALREYEEALGLFEELQVARPNDLYNQYRTGVTARLIGDIQAHLQRRPEADAAYRSAYDYILPLAIISRDVAAYPFELAHIQMNRGIFIGEGDTPDDFAEAQECFNEALEILEELIGEHPEEPQYARDKGATLCALGNLASRRGDHQVGLDLVRQSLEIYGTLCAQYPDNAAYTELRDDVLQRHQAIAALHDAPSEASPAAPANGTD